MTLFNERTIVSIWLVNVIFWTTPFTLSDSINFPACTLAFFVEWSFKMTRFALDLYFFENDFSKQVWFMNIKCPVYISVISATFTVCSWSLEFDIVKLSPISTFNNFANRSEITAPSLLCKSMAVWLLRCSREI